jgi:hypothetical protein
VKEMMQHRELHRAQTRDQGHGCRGTRHMSSTRVFEGRTKSRLWNGRRNRWLRGKEDRSTEMDCKHGIGATLEADSGSEIT